VAARSRKNLWPILSFAGVLRRVSRNMFHAMESDLVSAVDDALIALIAWKVGSYEGDGRTLWGSNTFMACHHVVMCRNRLAPPD
jgi:hypothetical protein